MTLVDGGVHDTTKEYDRERDAIIAARGLTVIRIPNEWVLNDLPGTLVYLRQLIEEALRKQAAEAENANSDSLPSANAPAPPFWRRGGWGER